jgi:hypothetical protein
MGSRWRRYSDYCRIDALEVFEPEIAKILKEKPDEWIFIKPNWYRFTPKNGIVNRTNDGYGMDEWKTHGFTEKSKHLIPNQTKFLVDVFPEHGSDKK